MYEIAGIRRKAERTLAPAARCDWDRAIMNDVKIDSSGSRARAALISLCVSIAVIACAKPEIKTIMPFTPSAAKQCDDWARQAFDASSPARDKGFISCMAARDPYASREDLVHRLETGVGYSLYDRLMSGQNLPIEEISNCAYMRMAVQSPAGSNELEQKPMRELFVRALTRAGFEVVTVDEEHYWWASSLALETGSNSVAWTILVRAVPEIGGGSIRFTTVNKIVDGKLGSFSGMQSLRSFDKEVASEVAWDAASAIAEELLPAANRRCDDIDAALREAEMRLEKLRNELAKEIERVRSEKAEHREEAHRRKQLMIEVEG